MDRREFWNFRSRSYDEMVGPKYEDAYRKTAECSLPYLKNSDRMLEFGCGTGIMTCALAPHVASVLAIDISDEMIAHARAKQDAVPNVMFRHLDLFDPSLDGEQFDVVAAYNVLLYLPDRAVVLRRIRSLLRPGGIFLAASDCLGQFPTKTGAKKLWQLVSRQMPFCSFDRIADLEESIRRADLTLLETQTLFPAPPNVFVAARKAE